MLTKLRRKRLAEMKAQARDAKFGKPIKIEPTQFVKEVQAASIRDTVVMLIYCSRVRTSELMIGYLTTLANRHKNVKFVFLETSEAIENFPAEDAPTVLTYKDVTPQHHYIYIYIHKILSRHCSCSCF